MKAKSEKRAKILTAAISAFMLISLLQIPIVKADTETSKDYRNKAIEMGNWLVNNQAAWTSAASYKFFKTAPNILALALLYEETGNSAYLIAAEEAADFVTTYLQLMDETTSEGWTFGGASGMNFGSETWDDAYGLIMESGSAGAVSQYANAWGLGEYVLALTKLNELTGKYFSNLDAAKHWYETYTHGSPETNYDGLVYKRMSGVDDRVAYPMQHGIIPPNNVYHTYGDNPYPFKIWTETQGISISALLRLGSDVIATELGDWLTDPDYGWSTTDGVFNSFYDFDVDRANWNQNGRNPPGDTAPYDYGVVDGTDSDILIGLLELYQTNPSAPNAAKYKERCIDAMDYILTTSGEWNDGDNNNPYYGIVASVMLWEITGDYAYLKNARAKGDEYLALTSGDYGLGNGAKIVRLLKLSDAFPHEVWVDDDYTGASCGGHIWGYDAFATIQESIDAVAEGGTVLVEPGTYTESVTVDVEGITIKGENLDAIVDGGFIVTADNVTIDGLTIQNGCLVFDDLYAGIHAGYWSANSNFNIINNEIVGPETKESGYKYVGINLQDCGASGTIDNNKIHDWITGIYIGTIGYGHTVTNNEIYQNALYGIGWQDEDNTVIKFNDIHHNKDGVIGYRGTGNVVSYNNIYNNEEQGVDWWEGEVIDATLNWWGDPSGPNAGDNPSATGDSVSIDVDYTPWLDAPYLTGESRSWNVQNVDTGENFNSIQAAIDDGDTDSGDTIEVAPGTYEEDITINKQLTLLGAQHGVDPTVDGARTDEAEESIIFSATGTSTIVIRASGVTVDGFTVTGSNRCLEIAFGESSNAAIRNNIISDGAQVGLYLNFAGGNTIANNVISNNGQQGLYLDGSSNNIIENNIMSNNNIAESAPSFPYIGAGIVLKHGSDNNTLTGNTVSNQYTGIDIRSSHGPNDGNALTRNAILGNSEFGIIIEGEHGSTGTVITYNTIKGSKEGISVYGSASSDTEAHYNNIENNAMGVLNETDSTVDATLNWWRDSSGPSGVGSGEGDAVSANVDYNPWLLEPKDVKQTYYDHTLALHDGWNLISTPKILESENINELIVGNKVEFFTYDNNDWIATNSIEPLDAVYVKMNGSGGIGLKWTTDELVAPPTKQLEESWNLVGPSVNLPSENSVPVGEALDSVNGSWSTVYSPALNQKAWTVTTGNAETENMLPYEGYWIYMTAADELAGRTT